MAWGTETWSSGSWSDGFPVTVTVTGVNATGTPGVVAVTGTANAHTTSAGAEGQVGTALANVPFLVTGIEATGQVGNVTILGDALALTEGNEIEGQVGTASATKFVEVTVVGVAASGLVGSATVPKWRTIVPIQGAGYIEITPTDNANWSEGSIH